MCFSASLIAKPWNMYGIFGGEIYSRQSNGGRELGDILLITEAGYGAQEVQE